MQSVFQKDINEQQAFVIGSDLEITYHSAQDSKGKLLTLRLDLRASPGQPQI